MPIALIILTLSLASLQAQTVEELTRQATLHITQHEWARAIQLLEEGLRRHPDQPQLMAQLGSLLVQSGRVLQGETLLERSLEIQPASSETLRKAAEVRYRQRDFDSALSLLRESILYGDTNSEAHHLMALVLLAAGHEREALEHSRTAVNLNPLEVRFRHVHALLLKVHGRVEEAEGELRFAFHLSPKDPKLLFQLSEARRHSGQLLQALEYMELASESDPENPLYHGRLADLHETLGDELRSRTSKQRAAGLSSAFESYVRAMRLSVQGKREESIRILELEIGRQPQFVTGMMLLADLYEKTGRDQEALDLYLSVLEQDPFQSTAREKGAWIRVRNGLLDSAIQLLDDSGRQSLNGSLIAGYQQMLRENWMAALDLFRQAESLSPLHPQLLQLISHCLNALGKTEEALETLSKAEELAPHDSEILHQIREIRFERALKLLEAKQWQSALDVLQDLYRQDVQPEYLLRMGYSHQQLGHLEEAVLAYSAGLEGDPTAEWARINLASSLYLLQRYPESAQQWEQLLSRSKRADTYHQLGMSYFHMDRIPEAEYALSKALELGDQRPEVLYNLGLVRLRGIRKETARELIRRSALAGYEPARRLLPQLER